MLVSLRDRKKLGTRTEILAAAAACIEREGYRNANMRDIAAAADVAYQTLYNYFPSKARIALALLRRDDARDGPAAAAETDPVEALCALAERIGGRVAESERELWLEAIVEAIRDAESPVVQCLDPDIGGYLRELLAAAQQRGQLDAYVDTTAMASVIESILDSVLLDRVARLAQEEDPSSVAGRIELVLRPYLREAPSS